MDAPTDYIDIESYQDDGSKVIVVKGTSSTEFDVPEEAQEDAESFITWLTSFSKDQDIDAILDCDGTFCTLQEWLDKPIF
jgi:hypothetical protein